MSDVKVWAFSICVAAVVGGIVTMVVPKGKMEKAVKVVVGIFFLSCVVMPLATRMPDIGEIYAGEAQGEIDRIYDQMQQVVTDQKKSQVEIYLKDSVTAILAERRIELENFSVSYTIGEDSSISISQVEVFLDSSYQQQSEAIGELIEEQIGLPVSVHCGGG